MNVNEVVDYAREEMQFFIGYFKPVTYLQLLSPTTLFYSCVVVVFFSSFSSLFSVHLGHLPKVWISAVSDGVIQPDLLAPFIAVW